MGVKRRRHAVNTETFDLETHAKSRSPKIKVARNSLLARTTYAAEHCHWITADARNIQT